MTSCRLSWMLPTSKTIDAVALMVLSTYMLSQIMGNPEALTKLTKYLKIFREIFT